MKTFIVAVNIILGSVVIFGGFQFGISSYQIITLSPALLVMALGLLAITFANAFQKNKKWGAIGLVILNLLVLAGTGYWAIAILLGFGEIIFLSMPLIALCVLVIETLFIRRHWLEFN